MARYVIGDVQGCFDELDLLLATLQFDPTRDRIYFVGDLVNRGPKSLEVLRWVTTHSDSVQTVLGNHDLHLLAVAAGISKRKPGDTLDAILAHPQCAAFCDWLRFQPLMIDLDIAVVVHAGIWPGWTKSRAMEQAAAVEAVLRGDDWKSFLEQMYGNQPAHWDEARSRIDKLRFTVNACTRMRFVDKDFNLQLKFKGEVETAPAGLYPWYEAPERKSAPKALIGHWSALGLKMLDNVWATDTGCIWGGQLTAINIDSGEVYQQPALRSYQAIEAG
ncbi:symmetrical bis(5'-nucleosyl)-tetraphosphatase [Amantichitinum ursilacus]|uniref:bis(5'-nucleosyl)-tetraphosphatase (symmetrical) n=1 Tax=Amantichitinum ursilacus TaxID=857265 RepID=A0A0N0GKP4_9NEIS|nr:symmetrical bis(5'-nucleosyl)-tetraphosphatase [Amantichitinum ursilacus]KPC49233.1 Bis(5'-nucleosyl)-tetraphosphatase, symmetrical [Amantichitinum ursilacus]